MRLCYASKFLHSVLSFLVLTSAFYLGGARSKGFATLRNVSKLTFLARLGMQSLQVFGIIWVFDEVKAEYLEITSISLIYSLTYSRKKELLFWLSRGLNRLTCVTRQIRGDSKLRDQPIALLRPKVVWDMKNSYEMMHQFRDKIGRASS